MIWIKTAERKPEKGQWFIGLKLHQPTNAPWSWGDPYTDIYGGPTGEWGSWVEPDVWCLIEKPELPDLEAKRAADEAYLAKKRQDIDLQVAELREGLLLALEAEQARLTTPMPERGPERPEEAPAPVEIKPADARIEQGPRL